MQRLELWRKSGGVSKSQRQLTLRNVGKNLKRGIAPAQLTASVPDRDAFPIELSPLIWCDFFSRQGQCLDIEKYVRKGLGGDSRIYVKDLQEVGREV